MLRDIEKENLENGMYIRFCLCSEEDFDTKRLSKEITSIENIKYAEALNSKVMIFIFYVDDPFSFPNYSGKISNKTNKQCKHAQDAYWLFEKNLKDFMEKISINNYYVYFTTTNHGSFIVGLSGRIERKPEYKNAQSEYFPIRKKDLYNISALRNISMDYLMSKEAKHFPSTYSFLPHLWRYVALNADNLVKI